MRLPWSLGTAGFIAAVKFDSAIRQRVDSAEEAESFSDEDGTGTRMLRGLCFLTLLVPFLPLPARAQTGEATSESGTILVSHPKPLRDFAGLYSMPLSAISPSHAPATADSGNVTATPNAPLSASYVVLNRPLPPAHPDKFNLNAAIWQSVGETMFYHAWRIASDPGMRWNLIHKPFVHDWFVSYTGYDMHRWGDGDDFIVNDVGHPLEGAVFARTFLQNSPHSQVEIGKNSRYWTSRLKATAWSALWSTQLEIGPLSETSIGNQGGFTYVPNCGIYASCKNNPNYSKPETNNTGWTDFVVTPLVGTAWVMGEDTLDKYVVVPVAVNHRILGGRILRTMLEPSRSFAAIFAGKFPWDLPSAESGFVTSGKSHYPSVFEELEEPRLNRVDLGTQYTNINLPVVSSSCSGEACRRNLSGIGSSFGYNFSRAVAFDSTFNFIPEQQGTKPMMQGLFGVRVGARTEHVGIFAKVRPGFIYYQNAVEVRGESAQGSLTRFAADVGGIVEYYPRHNATLRLDVGTTLVRYLTNIPDPRDYALGTLLSTQTYVTQGNFQLSSSYNVRF